MRRAGASVPGAAPRRRRAGAGGRCNARAEQRLGSRSGKNAPGWRDYVPPPAACGSTTPNADRRAGSIGTRARRIDARESLGGEPGSSPGRDGRAIDVSSDRYTPARRCVPRMGCPSRAVALPTQITRARASPSGWACASGRRIRERRRREVRISRRVRPKRATVDGLREPPLGSRPARRLPRAPRRRMRIAFLAGREIVTPARS
jgi:hypothetical protein